IVPDADNAVADCDVGQAVAVSESKVYYAGDAVGNGDANQGAPKPVLRLAERSVSDAGDAATKGDVCKAQTPRECIISDADDAVGDDVARKLTAWIFHKCRLAVIE